jgi:hypothetical protein
VDVERAEQDIVDRTEEIPEAASEDVFRGPFEAAPDGPGDLTFARDA